MLFRQIFDPHLAQYAYLIGCQKTKEALLVDPERDIDRYLALAAEEGLSITAVAETHIHADFLSGAREFAERHGVRLFLSDEGEAEGWNSRWAKAGTYDVTFLRHGDTFRVGNIEIRALHTPGHTPEHLSYQVTDLGGGATSPIGLITGDFVFVGDLGRPDLLESAAKVSGNMRPSARRLYGSARTFLSFDDHLQVWPGHGAGSACGKALGAVPNTTVGYERRYNAALGLVQDGEEAFVDGILEGQPEPPLYFARMKQLNRDGVPLLGALPAPGALSPADLKHAFGAEAVVVDTRPDRSAFMAHHLPGALYAPLGKQFSSTVGSYVTDPEAPLTLVIEEGRLDEAIRDLVRVGYDRVVHYVTPEVLASYFQDGGASARIEEVTFEEVEAHREERPVLDVRGRAEFESGHVPGALHAAHTRLADLLENLPRTATPLYVHCQTGARSAVASAYLAREGYEVRYVNDSFPEYAEQHEVEKGKPEEVGA